MRVDPIVLFISVATLFCYMLPGFILKKTKFADDHFAKNLSLHVLYVAQVCLLMHGFLVEFDAKVFIGIIKTLILAFAVHTLFYFLAKCFFRKQPDKRRRVLQFGIIFSNAGYMGIPVICSCLGDEYAIYATVYIVAFNVFSFSLGRLIYTDDKRYISLKQVFINPAVIPIAIGMICYVTGVGGFIQSNLNTDSFVGEAVTVIYNVITVLKNTVAPVSMIVIGARLADIKLDGVFKDKTLYPFLFIRLLLFPTIVWLILKPLLMLGVIDQTIMTVVLILSSTPAAAVTTMFAELYDGDSPYSGKLVAICTLCSVITMPIVALLMYI